MSSRITSLPGLRLALYLATLMIAPLLAFAQQDRENLTIGLNNVPNTLCITCRTTFPRRILFNVFDPLIGRDYGSNGQGTRPIPGLATNWTFISDTELDLTLRQGVYFHDGTLMTAEDVAFTLSEEKLWGKQALTPESSLRGVFKKVEVIDKQTVRITTAFPDPALIARLQSHIGRVVPKAQVMELGIDSFRLAPIGTGPFKIESFEPRNKIVLVANDSHWSGPAQVEKITFRDIPETSARVAGLLAGELDLIVGVLPRQFKMLDKRGFQTHATPQENIQMLSFMSGPENLPLRNPLLRRALVAAVDLKGISQALFDGTVAPIFGIQSSAYGEYYTSSQNTYQPDLARQLVRESGYQGQAIKLQFITKNFVLVDETVLLLQQQWEDIGLNVALDIIPDYTLHTLNPPTDVSTWSTSNNLPSADPYYPVCSTYTSDGFYASRGRITPSIAMDRLCDQLKQETDMSARAIIWYELQQEWAKAPQALFLWQRPEFYAMRPGLNWRSKTDFGMLFGAQYYPAHL